MKVNLVTNIELSDLVSSDLVTEPVTLTEAKNYLRVSLAETVDDDLITSLITTARQQIEFYLNISLIQRTVTAWIKNELGGMWLPYGPVITLVDVYKVNEDAAFVEGADTLLDTEGYYTQGNGFVQLYTGDNCYVKLSYSAGYENGIPSAFKTGILQQIAWLYEKGRGDNLQSELSPIILIALKPYRRVI